MVKKVNSLEKNYGSVLRLFLKSPTKKYHIREVAEDLKISPRTAKKYLERLKEAGLLKLKKEKLYDNYVANTESQAFRDEKLFFNVDTLRKSGLVDFIEREMNYPAIILYGSCGRGEDMENSDIDIFIIAKKCEKINVSAFEKELGREIHIMCMPEREFKKGQSKELQNNVLNGFVLSGFLEVF